jgi:hypothetical protein
MAVPGDFNGNNLGGKVTRFPRVGSALVALDRVGILSFARQFEICKALAIMSNTKMERRSFNGRARAGIREGRWQGLE